MSNIFKPILNKIDENEMLRYAGMRAKQKVSEKLVKDAIKEVLIHINPVSIWQEYNLINSVVQLENPYEIKSKGLLKNLCGAEKVIFFALTIGENIEQRISELFTENEYTKALLVDAAATAATEQSANMLCDFILEKVQKKGCVLSSRFSPGYSDWDIKEQKDVLSLSKGGEIGLKLTTSYMLMPRKSITAAIGVIPKEQYEKEENSCIFCDKADCQMRRI